MVSPLGALFCACISRRRAIRGVVIPGGLARVSSSIDTPVVSMQRGGGSKDTWVLSDGPVDTFSLQTPA